MLVLRLCRKEIVVLTIVITGSVFCCYTAAGPTQHQHCVVENVALAPKCAHHHQSVWSTLRLRQECAQHPVLRRKVHCTSARSVPGTPPWRKLRLRRQCTQRPRPWTNRAHRIPARCHWWNAVTLDTSWFVMSRVFPEIVRVAHNSSATCSLLLGSVPLRAERIWIGQQIVFRTLALP